MPVPDGLRSAEELPIASCPEGLGPSTVCFRTGGHRWAEAATGRRRESWAVSSRKVAQTNSRDTGEPVGSMNTVHGQGRGWPRAVPSACDALDCNFAVTRGRRVFPVENRVAW